MTTIRYDLTDLRLFVAIAEAQSLSAGADEMHLTASAASYRLKNLEQAMNTPLFVRGSRGMEPTDAGRMLLQHARGLMASVEQMHEDVGRYSSGLKGHVRLLANSSSLNGFIVPAMSRYLAEHPNIDIDLEERSSEQIPHAVAQREADIGIMAGGTLRADVSVTQFAIDRLIIVVPPGHRLGGSSSVQLVEALEHDFVCMSRTSSNYLFLRQTANSLGRPLRARIHAHAFDAVLALVAGGAGVALVPDSVAREALVQGSVAGVRLDERWARRELNLVTRKDATLPGFMTEFTRFLLDDPQATASRRDGAST